MTTSFLCQQSHLLPPCSEGTRPAPSTAEPGLVILNTNNLVLVPLDIQTGKKDTQTVKLFIVSCVGFPLKLVLMCAEAPVYKVLAFSDNGKTFNFKIVNQDSEYFKIDPESGVVSVKKTFSVSYI